MVKKKILTELGLNHVRAAITSFAPLPQHMTEWYRGLGLELLGQHNRLGATCVTGFGQPQPFALSLHLQGHAIKAADLQQHSDSNDSDDSDVDNGSDNKKLVPQILILSSGEMTAFKLDLGAPHQALSYKLTADALGRLTLKQESDSQ